MSYMGEREGFMDWAARCMEKAMKQNGGPLPKEGKAWDGPRARTTEEEADAAIALCRTGNYTMIQVARKLDLWPQTVSRLCKQHNIDMPCGYKGRRADAYYAERDRRAAA